MRVLESNQEMLSLKRQLEELGLQVKDPQARARSFCYKLLRHDKLGVIETDRSLLWERA